MVQEVLNISTILTVVHFLFEKSSQGFHKSLMLLIEQWLMGAETHAWVRNTPVQRVIKGAHQIPPGQKKGEIQRDMLDMSKGTWVGSEEVYIRNTQICMDKYTPKC